MDGLASVASHIERVCGDWLEEGEALIHAYSSISNALATSNLLTAAGPLRDTTTGEQRERVAEAVVVFWQTIPIAYEFAFLIPGIPPVAEVIAIAPGLRLDKREQQRTSAFGLYGLGGGLLSGGGALSSLVDPQSEPAQMVSCLTVESEGVMRFSSGLAASDAIRRASIVLQLGAVVGALQQHWRSFESSASGSYAKLDRGSGGKGEEQDVSLPARFADALIHYTVQEKEAVVQRLKSIGVVLLREPLREEKPGANEPPDEWELNRHCGRIATAAEWLFDSEGGHSATHLVQLAIAFEALYGGKEGEPVTETLANRVAYSLGSSPAQREDLRKNFAAFYGVRSKVVHSGATKLTPEQHAQFSWGRDVLYRALRHELTLATRGHQVLESAGKE
jgi:hypothetical protein